MAHSDNNKGRRNELRRLRYLRRVSKLRPRPGATPSSPVYISYMTTGTPCSCSLCKPHRFTGELKYSERKRIASLEDDGS